MNRPSQIAKQLRQNMSEKETERAKKARKEANQLKRDIAEIAATPSGKNFLKHLKNLCGYQKSDAVINPNTHDIMPHSTIFNAGRRSVYLQLRPLLDSDTLADVEIYYESSSGDGDVSLEELLS